MSGIIDLIPEIMKASDSGLIKWKQGEFEGRFSAEIDENSIHSSRWIDEDTGNSFYSASITNKSGSFLFDEVSADRYSTNFDLLSDLYASARRSALNVSDIVSKIRKSIKNLSGNIFD